MLAEIPVVAVRGCTLPQTLMEVDKGTKRGSDDGPLSAGQKMNLVATTLLEQIPSPQVERFT